MPKTSDFHFHLPEELIAQCPPPKRTDARMMVLDRARGTITHDTVSNFPRYLRPDDLVILNNTKVIAARAFTVDGKLEILLLEKRGAGMWEALVKPGKRARTGMELDFGVVKARVVEIVDEGARVLEFEREFDPDEIGVMPLPPYIQRDYSSLPTRGDNGSIKADETSHENDRTDRSPCLHSFDEKGLSSAKMETDLHKIDKERYQTTFAQVSGSSAAPTAGLHFTPELLAQFAHDFVTLHVGVGTFRPVKVEDVTEHRMHEERYFISEQVARRVNAAPRVVCVGTTSVRTLESAAVPEPSGHRPWTVAPTDSDGCKTDIFIYPPYEFKVCGALLTNFHLPQSTLLMMVSALAGREFVLRAYEEAIREKYRFFSYGDCMLIL